MRAVLRHWSGRLYQWLGAGILGRPVRASVSDLCRDWKRSDSLALLAPGASIDSLDPSAWEVLTRLDTIGVNYFLLHEFTARAYVIEPHEDRGYFDYLRKHCTRFLDSTFLYKGYASPSKIRRVTRELMHFRRAGVLNVRMVDERYLHDAASWSESRTEAWVRGGDSPIHSGSSLTYLLDLAWRMEYRHVIMVGFDFSNDYFYSGHETRLGVRHVPSKVIDGSKRGATMLAHVKEYVGRIAAGGGEVWHMAGRGPLAELLPEFGGRRAEK